jgi:hypothetical protein
VEIGVDTEVCLLRVASGNEWSRYVHNRISNQARLLFLKELTTAAALASLSKGYTKPGKSVSNPISPQPWTTHSFPCPL